MIAPNLKPNRGGGMSQVTEAMIEAGAWAVWTKHGTALDPDELTAIYLAMSSASPPVEQSEGVAFDDEAGLRELALLYNCTISSDEPQFTRWQMIVAMNHGARLAALTPPPVTVSVRPEPVAWRVRRIRNEPEDWQLRPVGAGLDFRGRNGWEVQPLFALKEGHSLSTVSGVVK